MVTACYTQNLTEDVSPEDVSKLNTIVFISMTKTCNGPTNYDCTECWNDVPNSNNGFTDEKTCDCLEGFYVDMSEKDHTKACKPCHKYCVVCKDSKDKCSMCIDNPGILKIGSSCTCSASGYFEYPDSFGVLDCIICHPLCKDCTGTLLSNCIACNSEKKAVLIAPNTCGCMDGFYFDLSLFTCTVVD